MSVEAVHWTPTDHVGGHRFGCVQCTTGLDRHLLAKLFANAPRGQHLAVTSNYWMLYIHDRIY